jgi:hypothetical protein
MARKNPSFDQLVGYMEKDDGDRVLFHNFFGHDRIRREEIVREFVDNARTLPKRRNGNALYHEILSFSAGHSVGRDDARRILSDIGYEYLKLRAPGQLAYGTLHRDTDHLHLHLCISSNGLGETKRVRLSKAAFAEIQKTIENLVRERYPELNQERVYTRDRKAERVKTASREQAYKERTGAASKKECIAGMVHGLFEYANSRNELDRLLAKEGFRIYVRGKTVGLEGSDGRKHRLKTLGLDLHYSAALERFDAPKDRSAGTEKETEEGAGAAHGAAEKDRKRTARKAELDRAAAAFRDTDGPERTR